MLELKGIEGRVGSQRLVNGGARMMQDTWRGRETRGLWPSRQKVRCQV